MMGSCTHGWLNLNDRCGRCEEGGRDPEGTPRSCIPMDVKGDESNSMVLLVQARSGLIPDEAFTDVKADDLVFIKNSCYDFIGLRKSSR